MACIAEYISKLLAMRTIRVKTGSTSSQSSGYAASNGYHYQAQPLLRPEEIMRLPASQTLIMQTGFAPVKAGQFVWYRERVMRDRAS